MVSEELTVRINGISSHIDKGGAANTSLSLFFQGFHLLVDAGNGIEESIKKGASGKYLPDAILVTHARRHHISDLPTLTRENAKVYCTPECSQQIAQELPSLATTTTTTSIISSINRLTSEFVNPKFEGNSLHGDGTKSMMMKGPELNLSISENTVKINITKGKKPVIAEDLQVSEKDSRKIIRYLQENFAA